MVTETKKIPKIEASYCSHSQGDYSLSLNIEEGRMVDLTSYSMGARKVTIYSLTPADMKALGQAIIEQATKIEKEAK